MRKAPASPRNPGTLESSIGALADALNSLEDVAAPEKARMQLSFEPLNQVRLMYPSTPDLRFIECNFSGTKLQFRALTCRAAGICSKLCCHIAAMCSAQCAMLSMVASPSDR